MEYNQEIRDVIGPFIVFRAKSISYYQELLSMVGDFSKTKEDILAYYITKTAILRYDSKRILHCLKDKRNIECVIKATKQTLSKMERILKRCAIEPSKN